MTCRECRDKGWMSWAAFHAHVTDAVLAALYPKATEPVCTCTVTPLLRTLDRECPVHWSPIPKATEGKS